MNRRRITLTLASCLALTACENDLAKKVTKGAVKAAVRASKGTASGLKEGIDEGRKTSVSADGAKVITRFDELSKVGGIKIWSMKEENGRTTIEFAIENKQAGPLRISDLNVLGLDKDGFAIQATGRSEIEATVPAKAKIKVSVTLQSPKAKLAKIRVGKHEMPVPASP